MKKYIKYVKRTIIIGLFLFGISSLMGFTNDNNSTIETKLYVVASPADYGIELSNKNTFAVNLTDQNEVDMIDFKAPKGVSIGDTVKVTINNTGRDYKIMKVQKVKNHIGVYKVAGIGRGKGTTLYRAVNSAGKEIYFDGSVTLGNIREGDTVAVNSVKNEVVYVELIK